ncbi:MAG: hypothetical protein RAP70_07460 [Candidatus Celaenobacter antarcticus]|nr:hypothetical protein [Candidatus Celaenobacter antarcticus]
MDILNSREWAYVIWFIIFVIFIVLSSKMKKVRESFRSLLKAFFRKKIISILSLMIIYISTVVYILCKLNLWEFHQLKNTIVWFLFVGSVSLFRINSIKKESHFFRNSIIDNLKLVAIIQFIVGFYTFSLFIELLIVPFIVLLAGMIAVSQADKKFHLLENILNGILAIFGLILIMYSIIMLITHFTEYATKQTFYDFYIPPLLTLMYLPFIYIVIVFITYEDTFARLHFFIKDAKLRHFTKFYLIFNFRLRIKLVDRWGSILQNQDNSSREEIKKSVKQIFKMITAEKNPPLVRIQEGWSPYLAKQFLESEGLKTGYYHPIKNAEWSAISPIIDLSKDLIPNSISYFVDGTETVAKSLELIMSIYSHQSALIAHNKLLSCVKTLLNNALNLEITSNIEKALFKGGNQAFKFGRFIAKVEKDDFPLANSTGYHIKFILSKVE